MKIVYFETISYKEFPRRFWAEVEDIVTLMQIEKQIEELGLGGWEFIFLSPQSANFSKGMFQKIQLFKGVPQ